MAEQLSRRGLFRAFTGTEARPQDKSEAVALIARVSEACVEPRGVSCRRCGEECDAGAIRFRPAGGGRTTIRIDSDLCSGCGACAPVCPTSAISMIAAERVALMAGIADLGRQA